MRIIDRGILPKPQEDFSSSNTFPFATKLPSGRWLAAFKTSEIKGDCDSTRTVVTWSDDMGKSWTDPKVPFTLPAVNGIKGHSRLLYFLPLGGKRVLAVACWVDFSDLSTPYYDPQHETLKDTRIFFCFSENDGETWSTPKLMDTYPVGAPVPLTGPPLLRQDGTIICQFEINKAIGDDSKWIHRSAMIFSYDGGKTWRDITYVTDVPDMYYWDQQPTVMRDGTIFSLFWTLDGKANKYLNIHASESLDGGKSWAALRDIGIYGQPGRPIDLGDGRVAIISIDRTVTPIIKVYITRDRGRTYDEELIVYEQRQTGKQDSQNISMNEAWDEMIRFSVGQPNMLNLGEGEFLAYYYAGSHHDRTSINYVRISV